MSTRGIKVLKKHQIPHEVVEYGHREKGAHFAAQAVGFALSKTIKTLVVTLEGRHHIMVLVPGDCQMSLKKVADACKVKKAALAHADTAQRLTGYLIGGISPFGSKKELPVLMASCLKDHPEVMMNAGQRGTMVKLSPKDIIKLLKPKIVDVVTQT